MSAKPDISPRMDLMPSNVIEAQIRKMEQDEIIIRALKKKNERLEQEKLEIQLQASVEVATAKLGQAQAFQRMKAIEDDLNDLRNWITGNLVQRDEFTELRRQLNDLSYRVPV